MIFQKPVLFLNYSLFPILKHSERFNVNLKASQKNYTKYALQF